MPAKKEPPTPVFTENDSSSVTLTLGKEEVQLNVEALLNLQRQVKSALASIA